MTLTLDISPSTVGKWNNLTKEERARLTALLTELIEATHEEAFRASNSEAEGKE